MDGENNGKPYEQIDDLGVNTPFFGSTPIFTTEHHEQLRPVTCGHLKPTVRFCQIRPKSEFIHLRDHLT